jgi:hypothetical protein
VQPLKATAGNRQWQCSQVVDVQAWQTSSFEKSLPMQSAGHAHFTSAPIRS